MPYSGNNLLQIPEIRSVMDSAIKVKCMDLTEESGVKGNR